MSGVSNSTSLVPRCTTGFTISRDVGSIRYFLACQYLCLQFVPLQVPLTNLHWLLCPIRLEANSIHPAECVQGYAAHQKNTGQHICNLRHVIYVIWELKGHNMWFNCYYCYGVCNRTFYFQISYIRHLAFKSHIYDNWAYMSIFLKPHVFQI